MYASEYMCQLCAGCEKTSALSDQRYDFGISYARAVRSWNLGPRT